MNGELSRRGLLAGVAGALTVTAGCVGGDLDATENVSETYDLTDVSSLVVDAMAVTIEGDDRDDVALTGTKRAAGEDDLEDVTLSTDRSGGVLTITVDRADDGLFQFGPSPQLSLALSVPRTLHVERVESTNGDVAVADVAGPTSILTTNGTVEATVVHGDVDVTSTNGDVSVDRIEGAVTVDATNGDVTVVGGTGDVDVETENGSVEVTLVAPPDATLDLETSNGDITVDVPGVSVSGDSVSTTLGEGLRLVSATTTNGDVTIRASE